jgi:hypothetical protein
MRLGENLNDGNDDEHADRAIMPLDFLRPEAAMAAARGLAVAMQPKSTHPAGHRGAGATTSDSVSCRHGAPGVAARAPASRAERRLVAEADGPPDARCGR